MLSTGCGEDDTPTLADVTPLFNPDNPSYHPVEAEGKNGIVPSLVDPYSETSEGPWEISIIKCTDCHIAEGSPLLVKNYDTTGGPEYPAKYDLCYSCHRRSSILGDESFRWHSGHIWYADISCYACHDSHGSSEYTHLIRFDTKVVFPNSSGILTFIDKGNFRGECSLTCHGIEHNELNY